MAEIKKEPLQFLQNTLTHHLPPLHNQHQYQYTFVITPSNLVQTIPQLTTFLVVFPCQYNNISHHSVLNITLNILFCTSLNIGAVTGICALISITLAVFIKRISFKNKTDGLFKPFTKPIFIR